MGIWTITWKAVNHTLLYLTPPSVAFAYDLLSLPPPPLLTLTPTTTLPPPFRPSLPLFLCENQKGYKHNKKSV